MNFSCLLCYQSSPTAVCHWCEQDTFFFDLGRYPPNLLHYGPVANHVKHSHIDTLSVLGLYAYTIATLVKALKFKRSLVSARVLASWFCRYCLPEPLAYQGLLLPVPTTWRRMLYRHFNQAELLASEIARITALPLENAWAKRKSNRVQRELNRHERLSNVNNAFVLTSRCIDHWVNHNKVSHVIVVDDVITTGVTVDTLAKQLKARYPTLKVTVWAMAFTPPPKSTLINE